MTRVISPKTEYCQAGKTLNFRGDFVSRARCHKRVYARLRRAMAQLLRSAASQTRHHGFFEVQVTGTPALQRTASRRATRCTASGERHAATSGYQPLALSLA